RHEPVRTQIRELLHHDRVVAEVAAGAAVLLGHARAEEPLGAHPPPGLAVGDAVAVPLRDLGLDLAGGEPLELRTEHLVLVGENVASHAANYRRTAGTRQARGTAVADASSSRWGASVR